MTRSLLCLAVFAVLLVTVFTSPPNIGRGNFSYDPKSIPQNESLLKLFIRLAVHTRNRLIKLKLKEDYQDSANGDDIQELPAFSESEEFDSDLITNRTMGRENGIESGVAEASTNDKLTSNHRDETNLKLKHHDNEEKSDVESGIPRSVRPGPTNSELGESASNNTKNPENGDIEIENRSLFDIKNTNYITHYADQSSNIFANYPNGELFERNNGFPGHIASESSSIDSLKRYNNVDRSSTQHQSSSLIANPHSESFGEAASWQSGIQGLGHQSNQLSLLQQPVDSNPKHGFTEKVLQTQGSNTMNLRQHQESMNELEGQKILTLAAAGQAGVNLGQALRVGFPASDSDNHEDLIKLKASNAISGGLRIWDTQLNGKLSLGGSAQVFG